jgi:hypothetical protein
VQRILLAVDPQSLEETGLIAAERQLGHQRAFLAYSRPDWDGAGFGKRPITPALAGTALNDNVPSVFLLNDFGIAGFAGVCLVLLSMAWFWLRAVKTQSPAAVLSLTPGAMVSLLSLVTWIYAAFYMMFANCGILLFTGKNVFLWGLNSTSDVFHSAGLLAFLIVPLGRAFEQAPVHAVAVTSEVATTVVGEMV